MTKNFSAGSMGKRNRNAGNAIIALVGAVALLACLVIIFYAFNDYIYKEKQGYFAKDYKEAEFIIDGERVRLSDATGSETSAKYFGNELVTDLNSDGRDDVVFLITQSPGGSGTFFYVVAALNTEQGYVGSEAVLLGDRIAPQTTEKGPNRGGGQIVIVNYADRAPSEPFTTSPSVGKTLWLILDPASMQFGQVEPNFEGEIDLSKMSLEMKKWTWVSALYNDGREVRPKRADAFTLTFAPAASGKGTFSATTDCNGMGGKYSASGTGGPTGTGSISFSEIVSTLMFCVDSQETEFSSMLQDVLSYHFTVKGELVLDLKFDGGSAVFR